MLSDWFHRCRAQLKHYSRYYHVDLKYHLSSPSTHVQNVLNFIHHCLLYIQPSCLLFQAVFIVDDLCSLCLCRTGAKPEKVTGLRRQPSSKWLRHYVRVMRSCIFPSTAASLFLLITGRKECSLFFVDSSGKECSLFLLITGRKECTLFLLITGRKECSPACLKAHLLCQ